MRAPIAKLRIAAGNPGWYDPLTNIHLTITRPEAYIYEGYNTTNIKKGIAHHLLHIVEGSLVTEEVTIEQEEVKVKEVREVASQVEEKTEEIATEEIVQIEETTESVEEVVIEETKEEVVEEKPKAKKTTTRKKATKKTEEK